MIAKPKMYDGIQLSEDFIPINLGGHKGIIMNVEEYTSPISGNTSLKVCVDTSKDDIQPEYFMEQYRNDTRPDKKYSNSAIKYVSLKDDENCVRMLKAFITAYENSNNCQFDWNKDWEQLKGKKIGIIFGQEEFISQDGTTKLATKLREFRSIGKIDNIKIPKVKLLDGSYVDYEEYIERQDNPLSDFKNEMEINPDSLPF